MNKALKINWKQQPWKSKSDKEIADKLGCSITTVRVKRGTFAPSTIEARGSRFNFDGLTETDWKKPNEIIAAKLGCSKTLVAIQRQFRGIPCAERRKAGGRKVSLDYSLYDPLLKASENAKILGCSVNYITIVKQKVASGLAAKPQAKGSKKAASDPAKTEPAKPATPAKKEPAKTAPVKKAKKLAASDISDILA